MPTANPEAHPDALAFARRRIEQLTNLLLNAQDVLIGAQNRLAEKDRELLAAATQLIAAKQELVEAKEAHRRDAMELTASEMRELGTKAELERAMSDILVLQREVEKLRRREQPVTWLRRMFGS